MVLPAETRVSQEADHATDEQVLHPNIGSWDSLPLELRLIIVGMLDVPTLRSFSSVSSACRAFCFRFLFKAMCFSSRPETTPSLASKMESFCSQSQVSLAMRANLDRIRSVKFRLGDSDQDPILPLRMAQVIRLMPNLRELSLNPPGVGNPMVHKIVWKLSGEPKLGITHLNLSDGCPYESHQTARLVEHFSGLEALSISSYEFLLGRKLKLQAAIRSQPQLRKLYVKFCERPRPFQITTMMAPPLLEMAEGLPYLECLVLDSPALGLGNDWGGGIEATAKFETILTRFIRAISEFKCLQRLAFKFRPERVLGPISDIDWDRCIRMRGWGEALEAREPITLLSSRVGDHMRLYVEFFRYLSMALPRIEQLYMDMDCRLAIEGIRSEKGKPMKIRVVEEAEVQALSSRYPFDFMN